MLVAALGLWAFALGEGPPELTMFDIWLPWWAVAGTGLLIAILLLGTNPWAGLVVAILAGLFGFFVLFGAYVFTEGDPGATVALWSVLFLGSCWHFRKPLSDGGDPALFGNLATVSLVCAVFALI